MTSCTSEAKAGISTQTALPGTALLAQGFILEAAGHRPTRGLIMTSHFTSNAMGGSMLKLYPYEHARGTLRRWRVLWP